MIKRALISCTDKTGLVEIARFLTDRKIEILSTGGTAQALRAANLPVTDVSAHTGFPEMLDGRVKTLHPKVHGGLLGVRDNPVHQTQMQTHGIEPIDLVIVNLYAFEKTTAQAGCTPEQAIENIDIGGPALLRSAAKNHAFVTVVTDPSDYALIQNEIATTGDTTLVTRQRLAGKVFALTAGYDAAIAGYFAQQILPTDQSLKNFPATLQFSFKKLQDLRYGENPHQQAAFYQSAGDGWNQMAQLQGKELSFNNILDTDAAYRCVLEFCGPAVVIVKHNNPCGVALGVNLNEAFGKAHACDPVSSFGGIVALNRIVDTDVAQRLASTFFEVVLAPDFAPDALKILAEKKNLRVLRLPAFGKQNETALDLRLVSGGALVQTADATFEDLRQTAKIATKRAPTENEWRDLSFVWKVAKHVKSNAIVFGKNGQTLGIGAGQMSRIDSTRIAALKARESFQNPGILEGSSLASDAFFPFRDGLDAAAAHGITAVAQPGGSLRDNDIIQAADEHGLAMIFTGVRHFRH